MANASALSPATKAPGFILHFSSGSAPWHRFGVEACMRRGTGSSMRFFPSLSSSQDPQILNVIVAVTGVSPSCILYSCPNPRTAPDEEFSAPSRPCVGAPHHRSVVAAAAAGGKGVEGARRGRERGARERVRVGREAGWRVRGHGPGGLRGLGGLVPVPAGFVRDRVVEPSRDTAREGWGPAGLRGAPKGVESRISSEAPQT